MRSWARGLALGLLLAAAIPSARILAAQSAEQILIDKANYWRLKDRPDLAIEALQKLLSINPSQPDALYQYGIIEVQQGKINEAKGYLARLQKAAPSSPRIADLENAIRAGQVSPNELSEARRLAQSGEFSQAAQKYQETFKGAPPATYGVEYYTTLAGTPQGRQEAQRGLEGLVQNSPNDSKAKLALAEILTYQAQTRARGIGMLAQLTDDPIVGAKAHRPWKQALMWLGTGPEDRQLYGHYLAKFPQDAEIRQHIAEAETEAAAAPAAPGAAGYADLNRGNIAAAERQFAADLRRSPGDPDALAGLGLVRLRQQRFGEARDLIGRAMHAAPARRGEWAAAFDSAVFWGSMQQARAARDAGNHQRAQSILSGLVKTPRSINWNAELVLGDVDARLGNHEAAEAAYRRVLATRPDDPEAIVGLYTALTAEGKTAEAASLSAHLASLDPRRIAGVNRARADLLSTEGKSLAAGGDAGAAQAKYQEALAVDPSDAWARLDYARLLVRQGEGAQAFAMIDPTSSGGTAEGLQAAAIFHSEQNRFAEALALVDRIPAGSRGADIAALRERLVVMIDIDHARQLARGGNRAVARNALMALNSRPPTTPEKTRLIAEALADIGATGEALQLGRPNPATAGTDKKATLHYAALLLKAGRDAEATSYLTQAESRGRISAADRRELEHLKAEIAAKRADQLRTSGDLAGAYDQISALLAAYPNDPTLLLAAGRIYAAAGQNRIAMRFFDAAFHQAPGDIGVLRGAVGGAIVAGDLDRARAYVAQGMQRFPNNPRLYYLEAEIARASGDNAAAVHTLELARRLDTQRAGGFEPLPSAGRGSAPGSPGTLPPNPFRRPQADLPHAPFMLTAATSPPGAMTGAATGAPTMAPTMAAAPELRPALPAPLQDTVLSADSDDLIVPPRAGEQPPRPIPANRTRQLALLLSPGYLAAGDLSAGGPAAGGPADASGSSDIGSGGTARELPPAPGGRRQLAQLEPLPPPPLQSYRSPAPRQQPVAPALEPLPPPPIQGYQPPLSDRSALVPQDSLELDIDRSLAAIAAEAAPTMQGGPAFRWRSGESGLGRLTEIGVPLETSFSPFYTGTARLQAIPTYLTAGTPSQTALPRFGHEALLLLNPGTPPARLPSPGRQNAGGMSLNAAYAYQNFAGEIGTTPLGFPVENLVGRVALNWPGPAAVSTALPTIPLAPTNVINPLQVRVEGARQPITDSLLSYAGTRDPVSRLVWGGVVKTGGDGLVSYDDGDFGMYGGGGAWSIDGKSVASNSELEGLVGAYVRPYRAGANAFKIGVNLSYMGYDKNLRFFTFGQGGYFSPQSYLNFSVPVEYSGRSGRYTYLVGGALGAQTFDEKRSPFLPTEPGNQAALQNAFGNGAFYPSRNSTGVAYNVKGQVEYRLDNGFSVGGLGAVDNAQNYTEGIAKLYLRKSFGAVPAASVLSTALPGSL